MQSLMKYHFYCQNPKCPDKGKKMPLNEEKTNLLQDYYECSNPECDSYLRIRH